jgi:hypothetical protein
MQPDGGISKPVARWISRDEVHALIPSAGALLQLPEGKYSGFYD